MQIKHVVEIWNDKYFALAIINTGYAGMHAKWLY